MAPSSLPWKTAAKHYRHRALDAEAKCRIARGEAARLRGELEAARALVAAWRPVLAAAVVLRNGADWPPMRSHVASLEAAVDALTPSARRAVHNA